MQSKRVPARDDVKVTLPPSPPSSVPSTPTAPPRTPVSWKNACNAVMVVFIIYEIFLSGTIGSLFAKKPCPVVGERELYGGLVDAAESLPADVSEIVSYLKTALQGVSVSEDAEKKGFGDFSASSLLSLGAPEVCLSLGNTVSIKQNYLAGKIAAGENVTSITTRKDVKPFDSSALACGSPFVSSIMKRSFFNKEALQERRYTQQNFSLTDVRQLRQRGVVDQFYVDHKRKFLYCTVAKASSTSMKAWMLNNDGLYLVDGKPKGTVHNRARYKTETMNTGQFMTDKEVQTILNSGDYFKFTIIRNPYTKLLSTYLERFHQCGKRENDKRSPSECGTWRGTLTHPPYENPQPKKHDFLKSSAEFTFEQVVELIKEQSPTAFVDHKNAHFISAQHICGMNSVVYDFIGRMEDKSDFAFIDAILGTKQPQTGKKGLRHSQKTTDKMDFFSPKIMELAREIYKYETQVFGYTEPKR